MCAGGYLIPAALTAKLAAGWSLVAAAVAATAAALLDIDFLQGLIIAATTGLIAAAGTILGAIISARVSAHLTNLEHACMHSRLDDIKRALEHQRQDQRLARDRQNM